MPDHTPGEWQPIDTAPKDGTEILAWRHDCGILLVKWSCAAEWLTEIDIEEQEWTSDAAEAEDWFVADFYVGSRLEGSEVPTHWMPLPAEPIRAALAPSHEGED